MKRALTAAEVDSYQTRGVVLVERAVSPKWIERLGELLDGILERPSPWSSDTGDRSDEGLGRAVDDRYLWRDHDVVRRFVLESGVASLVGQAMGCDELRFYFDHWLVKHQGEGTETPWHQDIAYWPFDGEQVGSLWLPLSEVGVGSSVLEFVEGSHRWGKRFRPERFVESDEKNDWIDGAGGERIPDIGGNRNVYDILVCAPMKPGDAVIFSAWVVHSATANLSGARRAALSTRWLGDDAVWKPHPAADPTVRQQDVSIEPGSLAQDDERFPIVWTRRKRTPFGED
ncbi:MAG TPA: phytanoyl-CoA dioxygenase family protein [Vicinamibacteria bacterium]|nr:phytanoyl-CoA dioxygenase family protein [Vicinamibacteria bacterium]